jgi:hypothetical protein
MNLQLKLKLNRSVHISHDTYLNLTGLDQYHVTEGNGSERNSFLREKNVVTYLIKPKIEQDSSQFINNSSYIIF